MSNIPLPGQIYRHFKGNLYRIVTLARHSETGEELVIYQALYGDCQVYARPLSMFLERISSDQYPEAASEYRFELMPELIQSQSPNQTQPQPAVEQSRMVSEEETAVEQSRVVSEEETARLQEEELNIDPLVLKFLDASTYDERLHILSALYPRITDEMINTMAMAVDLEIEEGDIEKRYVELRNCLLTFAKYECNRLR